MNAIQNLILCLKGPKTSETMWEFFLKWATLPIPIKSLIIIVMINLLKIYCLQQSERSWKTLIFVRTLISKHKIPYPGGKEADSSWKVKVQHLLVCFHLFLSYAGQINFLVPAVKKTSERKDFHTKSTSSWQTFVEVACPVLIIKALW